MTLPNQKDRRLIEDWIPVNEISIESIRERTAVSALPPLNALHVWWARRPLATSRAAIAGSILPATANRDRFYETIGTHPGVVLEQKELDQAKISGLKLKQAYSQPRAFTKPVCTKTLDWLQENLEDGNILVLDITAGGGSIPFEAGRLGIKTIANELNPVAALILKATCEWPHQHKQDLLKHYDEVRSIFLKRVEQLTKELYPVEPQPEENPHSPDTPIQRHIWAYLVARTVNCPSCEATIPLSPSWRLDSNGKGIRLTPDIQSGTCSFEIVDRSSDHSARTVSGAKATCPYPNCGEMTPAGYIPGEAQAGRLGHQLYCIMYRDSWYPTTKAGKPAKKPKTVRGFRIPTTKDIKQSDVTAKLEHLNDTWGPRNILPTEDVQLGDKTKTLFDYGMPHWSDIFSSRQLLAHGYCVQAFQDLVDQEKEKGELTDIRKAAWCYVALEVWPGTPILPNPPFS